MGPDPTTGRDEPLFNPRSQLWEEHFHREGAVVLPLTPTGRATEAALAMNRPLAVAIRLEEAERGRQPPPCLMRVDGIKPLQVGASSHEGLGNG